MINKLILGLFFIPFTIALGARPDIKVIPSSPLLDQHFWIEIYIPSTEKSFPKITFESPELNILDKRRKVEYHWPSYKDKRKGYRFFYKAQAKVSGPVLISRIKVQKTNNSFYIPNKKIIVRKGSMAQSVDSFIDVQVSKRDPYINEGVDLRYFLFYRKDLYDFFVLRFPQLNNFIKRFYKVKQYRPSIEYRRNEVYKKVLVYQARVYPEKSGKLIIDPIHIQANDAQFFGKAPFFKREIQKITIKSKPLELNVKAFPHKIPENYTHLMGDHKFQFFFKGKNFNMNDQIQFQFVVEGEGLLENYKAPEFYDPKDFYFFDQKVDFVEVDFRNSKKIFTYIMIPNKSSFSPSSIKTLFSFDPKKDNFVSHHVMTSEIRVNGNKERGISQKTNKNEVAGMQKMKESLSFSKFEPILDGKIPQSIPVFKWLNYFLIFILIIGAGIAFLVDLKGAKPSLEAKRLIRSVKKKGVSYSLLFKVIKLLQKGPNNGKVKALREIIESSDLETSSKNFLQGILFDYESLTFGKDKTVKEMAEEKKHVIKIIYQIDSLTARK